MYMHTQNLYCIRLQGNQKTTSFIIQGFNIFLWILFIWVQDYFHFPSRSLMPMILFPLDTSVNFAWKLSDLLTLRLHCIHTHANTFFLIACCSETVHPGFFALFQTWLSELQAMGLLIDCNIRQNSEHAFWYNRCFSIWSFLCFSLHREFGFFLHPLQVLLCQAFSLWNGI